MARAETTDFLHSMRFHVTATGGPAALVPDYLSPPGRPQAGFSAATTPESTVEAVEYKEGNSIFTKKFPGNPTMSDVTLSRGVARTDSVFWNWMKQVILGGGGGYRVDLHIKHYHREGGLPGFDPASFLSVDPGLNIGRPGGPADGPAKTYHVYEAFPIRHKVAADLDGTASEISVMELDVSYEMFDIEVHAAP